jgi:hypothetical protein
MAPRAKLSSTAEDLFDLAGLDADETAYVDDRYRILRPLGEGAFATVLLCADEKRHGELVAVKGVRTFTPLQQRSLMHEFVNARRLRHPNLVSILGSGVCRTHGLYLVMEYVDGPDLVTILEDQDVIPVDVAAEICRQVARGLAHMHRRGLVHRDVKPDNVFCEGARVKLGDFGASRTAQVSARQTVIFTPGYAAPETAQGRVDRAADAYALGALFHMAVTGRLPRARTARARTAPVSRLLGARGGARAQQLAERLLAPNPAARLDDMTVIERRFKSLTGPSTRRRLKHLVDAANLKRQRVDLERRWAEFEQRFAGAMKPFGLEWVCVECRGPVSEGMLFCPWCGDLLRFRGDATFPRYCERCEHGMHDEWHRCPWCGERYQHPGDANGEAPHPARDKRYEDTCTRCQGPMMRYMSFCPWCGEGYTWHTRGMEQRCDDCGFSVETGLFGHCPWCGNLLNETFAAQARARAERRRSGKRAPAKLGAGRRSSGRRRQAAGRRR